MDVRSKLQFVYRAKDGQELAERYDSWAPDYDRDVGELLGYVGPQKGAEALARYVAREARILDAGAGTGLVGQALHRLGYRNLVGVDNSRGMLSRARAKNVYKRLSRRNLGARLCFPTACFDALISIGVLTYGHARPTCLDELVRVTRPGGHIVFSLVPDIWENGGFKEKLAYLEAAGKWELVEAGEPFRCFLNEDADNVMRIWAYAVK